MAQQNARRAHATQPDDPSCAAVDSQIEVVERIFDPDISLAVLKRPAQFDVAQYLNATSQGQRCREVRQRVTLDNPEERRLFAGFAPGPGFDALVADYLWMLELFSVVTDAESVGVRLATTTDQTCPRFHVDHVQLRLICTWQGPATEWLDHAHVDRSLLGSRSAGMQDEESGLMRPGARIQRLGAFDLGFMKGEGWSGNEGRGLVHRSPAPGGTTRVMITMDVLA